MGDLTPHFDRREFDTHDGTRVPESSILALRHFCAEVLEPMRERFGVCTVTSGYRHPTYNARIGGARRSVHMYGHGGGIPGVAADVHFKLGGTHAWAAMAEGLLGTHYPPGGGLGEYPGQWVHIDTRSYRARWVGAS